MDQNTPSPRPSDQDDSDDTPRSELPSLAVTPTPAREDARHASEGGYFALKPAVSRPNSLLSPAAAAVATQGIRRNTTYPDTPDRPAVQRDLSHASVASVESNLSTVTVKASDSGHESSSQATSPLYTRPKYPNQAFSALQQQRYPPPHLPPTLRTKTLHPAQPENFRQAIQALHKTGAKTADNTPAVTPGLFTPKVPAEQSNLGPDEHGFYASPFLHFTHRQAPKETHIADVDIDPISGRKLINNYEIIDELGRGTHGKVKLGRNLATNEYVAIKIVERYSKKRRLGKLGNAEDKVKKEVAILKKARHPNIVALLEVIDDPARKKVYIVLERVELGEIVWRASAPKEVALVECRRYNRESRGIFDDEEAEAEDRAILDEAKTRRLKQQRRTLRKLRRQRLAGGTGPGAWSFEFGGDTDEDDSDAEHASRISTSTTEKSVDQVGIDSRQLSAVLAQFSIGESDGADPGTPVNPVNPQAFWPEVSPVKLLEGTMYGSYEEEIADKEAARAPSLASSVRSFGAQDLRHPEERRYWDASGAEILDADFHPDLQFVPCMSMNAARVAFRDTVLGLQYLHYQGIIHRDIKPPNLLQTADHRTKISDFGVSYLGRPINDDQVPENLSESDMQDFDEAKELAKTVGTAAFYAPELCYTDGTGDTPPVGAAIDVWALGITLFCMLFGRTPFVDNEFVVMRRIADEEIYVPRKRLRPVDPRPKSRPSSHGRYFPPAASGKRSEYELAYEELDDLLLDLFRRLLHKDPAKRITLEEVRHHPWVVQDISNKTLWLDETDPSRQSHGKKIQVSKEELQDAVVPVKLVERIRSGVKKTIGGLMSGLGRAGSIKTRTPSMSGTNPLSASSSSSAISQDGRRSSLRGDESIFSALKASREHEHPLAQSVTVSPEQGVGRDAYFSSASTPTGATDYPSQGDRSRSIMSTTTSVRTIKPSDMLNPQTAPESPPSSPGLGSSSFDTTVTNIGGLLSGAGRRILKSVRDRSTAGRSTDGLERSVSRAPSESSDAHGDPSIAVSTTQASGHLDLPDALKDITLGVSNSSSPIVSRSQSTVPPERRDTAIRPSTTLSRQVSTSSIEARRRLEAESAWDSSNPDRLPHESTEDDFRRAEDEWLRRSTREYRDDTCMIPSRATTEVPESCPPSPDDEFENDFQTNHYEDDEDDYDDDDDDDDGDDDDDDDELVIGGSRSDPRRRSAYLQGSQATSPTSHASGAVPLMTPSSSEDRFPPNTPMSCSNPSIPSFTTVDSEVPQEKAADEQGEPLDAAEAQFTPCVPVLEDDEYSGDNAIESDDDDYEDSSDDDGGLQMVRRRSAPFTASGGKGLGVSSSYLSRHPRRGTGSSAFSKKSSRSGSNNTMKKICSHDDSD